MKIEALFEKLAAACKTYIDKQVSPLAEQMKALQTQQKSFVVGDQIAEIVTPLLPKVIKGDPGHTPTADELRAIIEPLIPQPLKGDPGHTPTPEELQALIAPLIPEPVKGEPGEAPSVEQIQQIMAPLIPQPVRGEDGKTPTDDELRALIEPLIPEPVKGDPGPAPTAEQLKEIIAPMIPEPVPGRTPTADELKSLIAPLIPAPIPGRDALDFNPMPAIDETRSYPRNTYALHKGGIWRAFENTLGMRGWECIVRGFDGADLVQVDERTWTLKLLTSTDSIEKTIKIPSLLDRGVYKDGTTYEPGDVVTFGGNVWIAQKGFEQYGKPGEMGSGWRLSVRAGRDYRDPKR